MKKTVLFTLILFAVSAVSGLSLDGSQIQNYKQEYNKGDFRLPDAATTLVKDQKINVYFENETLGIVMNDTEIQKIETAEIDDPSLEVWVEQEAISSLKKSNKPRQTLKKALDSGTISYEAHGFLNKIKFWIAEMFL